MHGIAGIWFLTWLDWNILFCWVSIRSQFVSTQHNPTLPPFEGDQIHKTQYWKTSFNPLPHYLKVSAFKDWMFGPKLLPAYQVGPTEIRLLPRVSPSKPRIFQILWGIAVVVNNLARLMWRGRLRMKSQGHRVEAEGSIQRMMTLLSRHCPALSYLVTTLSCLRHCHAVAGYLPQNNSAFIALE